MGGNAGTGAAGGACRSRAPSPRHRCHDRHQAPEARTATRRLRAAGSAARDQRRDDPPARAQWRRCRSRWRARGAAGALVQVWPRGRGRRAGPNRCVDAWVEGHGGAASPSTPSLSTPRAAHDREAITATAALRVQLMPRKAAKLAALALDITEFYPASICGRAALRSSLARCLSFRLLHAARPADYEASRSTLLSWRPVSRCSSRPRGIICCGFKLASGATFCSPTLAGEAACTRKVAKYRERCRPGQRCRRAISAASPRSGSGTTPAARFTPSSCSTGPTAVPSPGARTREFQGLRVGRARPRRGVRQLAPSARWPPWPRRGTHPEPLLLDHLK